MKRIVRVSIIIPVYNIKPFLPEALDSVLRQTYKNLEIIVIDDGSTDGSSKVCEEYANKDKRIKLIQQPHMGLSAARNTGLNLMTGEVVAFLDSDDACHPDFIRKMVSTMAREKTDIVICKASIYHTRKRMHQTGKEVISPSIKKGNYNRTDALRALADGSINPGVWNKLYRKALWRNVRFPVGHVHEDVDTLYKVFDLCNRVAVLERPLYLYRKRNDSISSHVTLTFIDDFLLANLHFESFIIRNTPEIYTDEHLRRRRQIVLRQLVFLYARASLFAK